MFYSGSMAPRQNGELNGDLHRVKQRGDIKHRFSRPHIQPVIKPSIKYPKKEQPVYSRFEQAGFPHP